MSKQTYLDFLSGKAIVSEQSGFDVEKNEINPMLKPHQMDTVQWLVKGGQRGCFSSFGLGKTFIAIETIRLVIARIGGKGLFIAPLGVRHQFTIEDGPKLGVKIKYIRNDAEFEQYKESYDFFITNYERIRDGNLNVDQFAAVSLDEASVLRSTGSLTFDMFMTAFTKIKYKFVFTATPSPNRFIELINYAHFLGVMDMGQTLTRFFKRDSQKAGNLKIHPHKTKEFWQWVSTWALMLHKPSDIGHSNEGYDLPELKVIHHEIPADHTKAWDVTDDNGQRFLLQHEAVGLVAGAKEKRESLPYRIEKAVEIIGNDQDNWIIWHHLESERVLLEKTFKESKSIYGSQDIDLRETIIHDFSNGKIRILNTKPELSGSGCNFQRHCHKNLFLGINYDFNDFIQAIHRTHRFLQEKEVEVHLVYTETERAIVNELLAKWERHKELTVRMREVIAEHGMDYRKIQESMRRSIGVDRLVFSGENYELIHNDCVLEMYDMADNSVDLTVTSIPFSNHYEYTPSYNDFGHTNDDDHFFAQMDFMIENLLRVTKPGRLACIHVKDRIFYGSQTGIGFSTVNPFHAATIFEFMKHGWEYMGMHIIHTDVVAENNQTYRLTYGEMLKDSTKMGAGSPEYVLLFRKRQTNTGKAYADVPVAHTRSEMKLGEWQLLASANWRSSGNRNLSSMDIAAMIQMAGTENGSKKVRKAFREHLKKSVYNWEQHRDLADGLSDADRLPKIFELLTCPVNEDMEMAIWEDVNRMLTLNLKQAQGGKEQHVCPLQFDIVDRCINLYSNKGELVFDPFGGLGTVPLRAAALGRKGKSTELNKSYWQDSQYYCKAQELKMKTPTLFDLVF